MVISSSALSCHLVNVFFEGLYVRKEGILIFSEEARASLWADLSITCWKVSDCTLFSCFVFKLQSYFRDLKILDVTESVTKTLKGEKIALWISRKNKMKRHHSSCLLCRRTQNRTVRYFKSEIHMLLWFFLLFVFFFFSSSHRKVVCSRGVFIFFLQNVGSCCSCCRHHSR